MSHSSDYKLLKNIIMFTGQIIGYVGADARQNKNGKGFNFHVSTKYKNVNNEEQTLWVCCFVNYESKVFEYLKKGTQVYVCGDVYADVFQKDDGSHIPSVSLTVSRIELLGKAEKKRTVTERQPDNPNNCNGHGKRKERPVIHPDPAIHAHRDSRTVSVGYRYGIIRSTT